MFDVGQIQYWTLLIGGLGVFIFGITSLCSVLKRMATKTLRTVISKCSSNRIMGSLVGAGFTALIHSSAGTSALTIGLVRAGAMTLIQAAAIIVGANVGTAITAFIISIPVMEYFPLVLFVGSMILLLCTRRKWTNIGELLFAFGAVFFGLWIMEIQLKNLAVVPQFQDFFVFLTNYPWLGLLMGALITAVLTSSSAVVGVVQIIYASAILAGSTNITLFGLLPLIFGSNIGTTITAILSSIGGSKESKRVALFHVFFNVTGSLLFMGVLYACEGWLKTSPTWAKYGFTGELQIAMSHVIFNLTTALIFLPLLGPICKLLVKIIPGDDKSAQLRDIKELDSKLIKEFPSQGIVMAKEQVISMFKYTKLMFETLNEYLLNHKQEDASFIHDIEASIDRIDRQVNEYLMQADKGIINDHDILLLSQTLKGCKDIERIGDYGENLIDFYENMVEKKNVMTPYEQEVITKANNDAIILIDRTIKVFKDENKEEGLKVIQERRVMNHAMDESIAKFFEQEVASERTTSSYINMVFVDICNSYQGVYSHCSNICKLFGTDKEYNYSTEEQIKFFTLKDRY